MFIRAAESNTSVLCTTESSDAYFCGVQTLGNLKETKILIDQKANIDSACTDNGSHALHIAAHK